MTLERPDRLPHRLPQDAEGSPDSERIQRWRWMLEQRVPIIGGWMHRRITTALTESALAGNWLAAQSLAVVYVAHEQNDVRRLAGQTLQKINYATGIDAVWGVWAETRHPGLEKIALSYNRPAGQPASIRLLSALKMGQTGLVTHGSGDLVPALIRAWDDSDPQIAALARAALAQLQNQSAIDALCSAWLDNRYPFLGEIVEKAGYVAQKPPAVRVLTALKANQLEIVQHATSDMVAPLVTATQYADPQIANRARECLTTLKNPAAVDELCRMWASSRSPFLEGILLQAGYQARSPVNVRLLVALKTGQFEAAENAEPRGLPHLIEAMRDADPGIRSGAERALANLRLEETREAVCLRFLEDKHDRLACDLAVSNGYAPRSAEVRALFYFLTGQWQAYDSLDFDQSILRAVYEASPVEMRLRISTGVQAAGRTDYLTILAGLDYRSRSEEVTGSAAELMIRILAENREYARLWSLITEFALPYGIKIMRILVEQGWRPENEIDRAVYADLERLVHQPMLVDEKELNQILQVAISRSNLRVKGRVNEVAFSPTRPVLAIATNQRKVVLWNFQDAVVERVLDGFEHSVGRVNFTPQGILIAAERTSTQAACAVRVWDGHAVTQLCTHTGTVTGIEPVGENNLLTTGRDRQVILWDLVSRRAVKTKEFDFWVRSLAVSADQQYAALLHDRLSLVRLPDLGIVPGYAFLPPRAVGFKIGVAQNAAFSPDGRYILAGQYNGQVGLYYHTSLTQRPHKVMVTKHTGPVRGIHFLPGHPMLVTAGAEGRVRFLRWPEMEQRGTVMLEEGQLTSLRVSHQGAFMATGANDASLVLWDLRALDIPDMFSRPLATATHEQVANTLALSEYNTSLPESVRNGLKFLRILLQYRFRFDIHLEEAPSIRFGEYDIILDEQ